MGERLQRQKDVLTVLKVGKTEAKRFTSTASRVQLGPRSVAYTDSSLQRLIQEFDHRNRGGTEAHARAKQAEEALIEQNRTPAAVMLIGAAISKRQSS